MSGLLTDVGERLSFVSRGERVARAVRDRTGVPWYIFVISVVLFVGFSVYTTLLYESFWTTGADLGTYVHMFSTTLSGDGFLQQGKYVAGHPGGSYWGGHFTLTLFGFLPVFALVESPITLLVAKSFVLAASVPVAWLTIRDHIDDRRFVDLLTLSYAFNPFLWSAWIYDFQEQALLPILVLAAYRSYYTRRYRLFLLFLSLVLVTNELMVLIVGGFLIGLAIAAYRTGRLREELPVFTGAIVLTGVMRYVSGSVISSFSRVSGIRQAAIAAPIRPFVEGTRATTGGLVSISLGRPSLLIDLISHDFEVKAIFFVLFLLPVLFLAIADEATLGALTPFLGFAWLFTGTRAYYTFDDHYAFYILPFVYIGAARVLRYALVTHPSILPSEISVRRVLFGSLIAVLVINPILGVQGTVSEKAVPHIDEHTKTLETAIDAVPQDESLVTQNTIYPHVATRPNATFIPNPSLFRVYKQEFGIPRPKYVLFDVALDTRHLDWSEPIRAAYIGLIGSEYGLYRYQDGIWILRRGYNGPVKRISDSPSKQGRLQFDADEFSVSSGHLENGHIVSTSGVAGSNVWHGPYTALPAGNYTATFQTSSVEKANNPNVAVDVAVGESHRTIARKQAPTGDNDRTVVNFTLDQPRNNVEFRGFRTGDGIITLKSVIIRGDRF